MQDPCYGCSTGHREGNNYNVYWGSMGGSPPVGSNLLPKCFTEINAIIFSLEGILHTPTDYTLWVFYPPRHALDVNKIMET